MIGSGQVDTQGEDIHPVTWQTFVRYLACQHIEVRAGGGGGGGSSSQLRSASSCLIPEMLAYVCSYSLLMKPMLSFFKRRKWEFDHLCQLSVLGVSKHTA